MANKFSSKSFTVTITTKDPNGFDGDEGTIKSNIEYIVEN